MRAIGPERGRSRGDQSVSGHGCMHEGDSTAGADSLAVAGSHVDASVVPCSTACSLRIRTTPMWSNGITRRTDVAMRSNTSRSSRVSEAVSAISDSTLASEGVSSKWSSCVADGVTLLRCGLNEFRSKDSKSSFLEGREGRCGSSCASSCGGGNTLRFRVFDARTNRDFEFYVKVTHKPQSPRPEPDIL